MTSIKTKCIIGFLLFLSTVMNANLLENNQIVSQLIVTSTVSGAPGSFTDILSQAKSSTEDVLITFSVSTSIKEGGPLIIENANSKSITIDGTDNTETGKVIVKGLGMSSGGNIFEVLSSNVTIKNLDLRASESGVLVKNTGTNFTMSHCTTSNIANVLSVKAENASLDHTLMNNCTGTAVYVNKPGFTSGPSNHIYGANSGMGKNGFLFTSNAGQPVLGSETGDRDQYSFIGKFAKAIYSETSIVVREFVIGGKANVSDYCATTAGAFPNTSGIVVNGKYGIPEGLTKIGGITNPAIPSVIISGSIEYDISLTGLSNVEIDNSYIGQSPYWCNGVEPSSYHGGGTESLVDVAISVLASENVRIGNIKGNIIGNAKKGVYVSRTTSATSVTPTNISIRNNHFGMDPQENVYPMTTGLDLLAGTHITVDGNIFSNTSGTGISMRGDQVVIKNNHIGISPYSVTPCGLSRGIATVLNSNSVIENNYFGDNSLKDIYVSRSNNMLIRGNTFGERYDGTLISRSNVTSVEIREQNSEITVEENDFSGVYKYGVMLSHFAPASWTDYLGETVEYSTAYLYKNKFNNIVTNAIVVGKHYDVKIGKSDDPSSGNEILNAPVGINGISLAVQKKKIEAYHNYIGIGKDGSPGSLNQGILITNTQDMDQHIIEGNVIANCAVWAVHLNNVDRTEISKNELFNNVNEIKINNSNLLSGSIINEPTITVGSRDYDIVVSGYSNDAKNGTFDAFRFNSSNGGSYEYVSSGPIEYNGYFQFVDKIVNQDGYDGYVFTVTTPDESGSGFKTSNFSQLYTTCVSSMENDPSGCFYFPEIERFVKVEAGEIETGYFEVEDNLIGILIDNHKSGEIKSYQVYDYKHQLIEDVDLVQISNGKYVFDSSNLTSVSLDYRNYYTLEITDADDVITKYRFKI